MEKEPVKNYDGVRQTPIRSIKSQFIKLIINRIMPRKKSGVTEPNGSSCGGSYKPKDSFMYTLTSNLYYYNDHCGKRFTRISRAFNKPQLKVAIVRVNGKKFRII